MGTKCEKCGTHYGIGCENCPKCGEKNPDYAPPGADMHTLMGIFIQQLQRQMVKSK